jgi:16S rRNA (guanine966-N2)-methyltransferase
VRVIAGVAKGRRLHAAPGTRPTADSVKEALFSSIGSRVAGRRVLDLYAGSGALGIEALSRGAGRATFVERDPRAVSVIRRNLGATGLSGQARVVQGTVERFLSPPPGPSHPSASSAPPGLRGPSGPAGDEAFDVVLADPPYADDPAGVLGLLSASGVLAPGAVVALEVAASSLPVEPPAGDGGDGGGLSVRTVRRYGDSAIVYAEHLGAEEAEEAEGSLEAERSGRAPEADRAPGPGRIERPGRAAAGTVGVERAAEGDERAGGGSG